MDHEKIQIYLSRGIKALFIALGVLLVLSVITLEVNKKSPEELAQLHEDTKKIRDIIARGDVPSNPKYPNPWPPKMNSPYPEMVLFDQDGQEFSLSSLEGKVVVVEYVDISSPVSQAQSGAAKKRAYVPMSNPALPQDVDKTMRPFSDVLAKNTGGAFTLPHEDIIELKIIVYGENGATGSRDDAQHWAQHFGLKKSDNVIVAVPEKDLRGDVGDALIGGFQLIDRNMLLRVDSSGRVPKHNLQMTLVPLVPKIIR